MGWLLLSAMIVILTMAIAMLALRRAELRRMSSSLATLAEAKVKGSHRARLQYPNIDLSRCIGCGTCVKACPEDGVLDLIHGQAVVIHGGRCVGHGLCAEACPVGAIDLTLGDLQDRRDIPAVTDQFEVVHSPGLFLAGEVTGYALIRTAISHGTAIVEEVAKRLSNKSGGSLDDPLLDLCIVGAGPAGVAASLQAKLLGLDFVTLEQDALGGTVTSYPRRKLVMTQPVELPLHGRLKRTSYQKEELVELWNDLAAKHELPVRTGEELIGVDRTDHDSFIVKTHRGEYHARFVCLALGRRGTPRKLGVPGEQLPKVAYSLIDAQSYQHRRILVVGGGDSAIEAALGLAEQPGNQVTLSYRKSAFSRIKARNEARLLEALQASRLACVMPSQLLEITPASVRLTMERKDGTSSEVRLDNDEVFIMAGGIPPFELLEKCGVSFDPADRIEPPPLAERGTGLLAALASALVLTLTVLVWVLAFKQYYWVSQSMRPLSELHDMLRPSSPFGLACGLLAVGLIALNLCYLLRRNWFDWIPGSLTGWMTSHVITGILILLLVLLHSSMSPRQTVGGHAFAALGFLVITGAIGRYFYSFVPRAANGKELALEELNDQLATESTEWDRFGRAFGDETRQEIHALVSAGRWNGGFIARLATLLSTQSSVKATCRRLRDQGHERGLSEDQIDRLLALAQRLPHRIGLGALRGPAGAAEFMAVLSPLGRPLDGAVGSCAHLGCAALREVTAVTFPLASRVSSLSLGLVAVIIVIGTVYVDLRDTSPGELSSAHAQHPELTGAQNCQACHGAPGQSMSEACIGCHQQIDMQLLFGRGFHGNLSSDIASDCAVCHSEHHGSEFAVTNARSFQLAGVQDPLHFGHEGLEFHLQDKHLAIGCDQCHPNANVEFLTIGENRFLGLDQSCTSCHRDVHEGGYGRDCASCHGQQHPFPRVAEFVHTQAFELAGAHGKAACNACHRPDSSHAIASLVSTIASASSDVMQVRSCRACHESPHDESFVTAVAAELKLSPEQSCQHCHPAEHETFVGSKSMLGSDLHAHTGFALDNPHDRLKCDSCHADFGKPKLQLAAFRQSFPGRHPDDCQACHRDPHQGQFEHGPFRGADCLSCHQRHTFEPSVFTVEHHAQTEFPLRGEHATVACKHCHKLSTGQQLVPQQSFVSLFNEPNAKPSVEPTLFRVFHGTSTSCKDCHQDPHKGQFELGPFRGKDCQACHDEHSFRRPTFSLEQHAQTPFALSGAHAAVACGSCHDRPGDADPQSADVGLLEPRMFHGTPTQCSACHVDVHDGQFDQPHLPAIVDGNTGCARCHSTESFQQVRATGFDHTLWTGYELRGAHARAKCIDCHAPATAADPLQRTFTRVAGRDCQSCHRDPHVGQFGPTKNVNCAMPCRR